MADSGKMRLTNAHAEVDRLVQVYRSISGDPIGVQLADHATRHLYSAEAALARYRASEGVLHRYLAARK